MFDRVPTDKISKVFSLIFMFYSATMIISCAFVPLLAVIMATVMAISGIILVICSIVTD